MPEFVRTYPPAVPPPGPAVWLPFLGHELVVEQTGDDVRLLRGDAGRLDGLKPTEAVYLGLLDGRSCLACELAEDAALPDEWRTLGLRDALAILPAAEAGLAGYAAQMLYWRATSGFCPVCGHPTEAKAGDWGRHCLHCGHDRYPHLSPAVLVLVHDGGDRVLLAYKPGWTTVRSILAGFVEPGESLEECARREVREEVGLEVTDLIYQGSQPWPFPHQLMVGFTARWTGGEIQIDQAELAGADWYGRAELPDLPSPISLSRQIIDAWVGRRARV